MNATRRRIISLLCLIVTLSVAKGPAWSADLTFLHLSDVHYPHAKSESIATIAALPREPTTLSPYNLTAAAPAFAIVTGDLNEFGGGNGAWEGYLDLWRGFPLPLYHQLGNHDNTWDCGRPRLRQLHGSPFYSFEHGGARFIGFDTATPHDPRPSIPTEGLLWLAREFEKIPPEQPVIFFCHHPLNGREFASDYARLRLIELLQTRNVVVMLVGHGHSATKTSISGIDSVMGGSTWGAKRGYGIVSLKHGIMRVCHQFLGAEAKMIPLLEKPLPAKSPFIQVGTILPGEAHVFGDKPPQYRLAVADMKQVAQARWICGDKQGDLIPRARGYRADLPSDLAPGAHAVRFELTDASGLTTVRTRRFWIDSGPMRIRWVRALEGSCQSSPTLSAGRLFIGANDGTLRALKAATGKSAWGTHLPGEVRSTPAVLPNGDVCAAQSGGAIVCRGPGGAFRWQADAGAPVYASPIALGDRIVCANNNGQIMALSAADGKVLWRCDEPTYAIESGFAASADTVFTGSWDGYVYAINMADGTVRWKSRSAGSNRQAAPLYYSPADCAPVYAAGRVFVADRAMMLSVFNAGTGELLLTEKNCSAVGAGADETVLVRQTDNRVTSRRADGTVLWEAKAPTGFVPTPPVAADGKVWVVSSVGLLSVLDTSTGAICAQVQAAPGLFVFAAPAASGNTAYVADEAGDVVALQYQQ